MKSNVNEVAMTKWFLFSMLNVFIFMTEELSAKENEEIVAEDGSKLPQPENTPELCVFHLRDFVLSLASHRQG